MHALVPKQRDGRFRCHRCHCALCFSSSSNCLFFLAFLSVSQDSAQDLSTGAFRDLVDELHQADLLVRRHPLRNVPHDVVGGEGVVLLHDEGLGQLIGLLIRDANDGGVGDLCVPEEERLQLRGGDLVALVLDELLEAVDDEEVAVFVHQRDVAGVEKPILVDGVPRRLLVVQVAFHDLGAADPDLALPPRGRDDALGLHINQLRLRAPNKDARAAVHLAAIWYYKAHRR
mmetsp:Transcript_20303/g.28547  ORF Transcript_20303/g.28547 Transcript_20303/m.28547 type:complete len:230 (-) Transcript_20303:289-978(-)